MSAYARMRFVLWLYFNRGAPKAERKWVARTYRRLWG